MANVIERLEELAATPRGSGEGHVIERAAELWECARCGFTMLADHKDDGTEGYSCPACFEVAVRAALPDLLKLARAAAKVSSGLDTHVSLPFPDANECREGMHWELPCEPIGTDGPALSAALEPLFREVSS